MFGKINWWLAVPIGIFAIAAIPYSIHRSGPASGSFEGLLGAAVLIMVYFGLNLIWESFAESQRRGVVRTEFEGHHCKKCGKFISPTWAVCPHCGERTPDMSRYRCGECGVNVENYWAVCPLCGRILAESKVETDGEAGSGEEVLVKCALCGKKIRIELETCPYCGTTTGQ